MFECEYCREKPDLLFECSFCHKYFCEEHLPAHKHFCTAISREDAISTIVGKTTLSQILLDSLHFVARMVVYVFIIAVAVLAVDAVALSLLNLWNMDTWQTLLWCEGVVMAFLGGTAGLYHSRAPAPWPTPMGTRLYRIMWAVRKPLLWASVGIAGLMLILFACLIYWTAS